MGKRAWILTCVCSIAALFAIERNFSSSPKLQLVRAGAGSALMYNQDGKPYPGAQYIVLDAIPNNYRGDISTFHRLCGSMAPATIHSQPGSVRYRTRNQMIVCDAWGSMTLLGRKYFAALMLSDGWIVTIHGRGDPDAFESALLGAQMIPRPSFKVN